MMYLADLQLLDREVHTLDIRLKFHPSPLHICLQPQDLTIDRQARLHALINDSEDLLNSRTIMLLLGLVIL